MKSMDVGNLIHDSHPDYKEPFIVGGVYGGFGFLAGLGIWLFYRLVRFAVKG